MPMGSWIVAIDLISVLKKPMSWVARLLFMPPTETAIPEVSSTVRDTPYTPLDGEGEFEIGRVRGDKVVGKNLSLLGELEG